MALYLYYAADQMYQGLHGMESFGIIDEPNLESAYEEARTASREVITTYNNIIDELSEAAWESVDAESYAADGETVPEEAYEQALEDAICEDMYYQVWRIKPLITQEMSYEELEELVYEDFEAFTEEYCELEDNFLIEEE